MAYNSSNSHMGTRTLRFLEFPSPLFPFGLFWSFVVSTALEVVCSSFAFFATFCDVFNLFLGGAISSTEMNLRKLRQISQKFIREEVYTNMASCINIRPTIYTSIIVIWIIMFKFGRPPTLYNFPKRALQTIPCITFHFQKENSYLNSNQQSKGGV